ncbi:MAG: polyphosphate kinase 1 [Trueperaceae bacterium]|nr:polyphosphate kinase 1 [Trueperaceae bacterium]
MSEPSPVSDLRDPQNFFNRELSWLKFNERVLEEAADETNPLLERLKFLAIFSTNLDEFIMIRYAGLKEQLDAGIAKLTFDGLSPAEQLNAISKDLHDLVSKHRKILGDDVLPALCKQGVCLVPMHELNNTEQEAVQGFFHSELFPVLTPLAVDSGHPFPRLPNLSFCFLLEVKDNKKDDLKIALVQVPNVLPRFFALPGKGSRFVILEDILTHYAGELFPGYSVKKAHAFRITRNADFEIAEDEADDLLLVIEDEVRRRRWGDAVRLEVSKSMPRKWRDYLRDNLELSEEDVYEIPHYLNVGAFMELASLDIPELKDPPFVTRLPTEYRNETSIFDAIHKGDILIHHPFHAFDAVLNLIEEAADDPNVMAIKQTLYRVGRQSPVVAALMRAAGNGKLVTALVELKARFDEENNIGWARELERSGVHVVYGFPGLKTHCKTLLIVRREGSEIKRYVHLGTGNYNKGTSTIYTDFGLLTCDPQIGKDASELFNYLTGFSKQDNWRKLWVAPETLKNKTLEAIQEERDFALAGKPAQIIAKMNALVDPDVITALYEASQAGVKIDLVVRGICCLRPGVKGLSETITVRSVVGRFLEHSRVYYFHHGGREDVYIGSADWMQRNLTRRVEALAPIQEERLKKKIMDIVELYMRDNQKARMLKADGRYTRPKRQPGQHRLNAQERLLEQSARRLAEAG